MSNVEPVIGLGLPTGSRLRSRLESAASRAVRTPVLAVIEYNYEREGEIVVPGRATQDSKPCCVSGSERNVPVLRETEDSCQRAGRITGRV